MISAAPIRRFLFLLLFGAFAPASAQEGRWGMIAGRVVDEAGGPVVGATVELTGPSNFLRRTPSGPDGSFRFIVLPPGSYRISARHLGFRATDPLAVAVGAGEREALTLRMELAPVALESVEVVVSPVTISRTDTEFAMKVDEATIELLPIPYDAKEIVALTPGARQGYVWGGATDQANNYQIDGLAANHPGVGGDLIQPSITWIESIEVAGLGAGAEHGNFQGGLINVTTKSGTNELQGSFRTTGESDLLNASNLGGTEIGSEVGGRYDVEGEIRGPLMRDRLFYFLAGHWFQRSEEHLNHLPQFEGRFLPEAEERTEGKFFSKLTWTPNGRNRVDLSAGGIFPRVDRWGLSGYESPEAALRLEAPTTFYSGAWRHTFGARSTLEAKVAHFARDEVREPYAGPEVPGVQIYGLVPPYSTYRNAPLRYRHAPESISASAGLNLGFGTFGAEHLLKVGGEYSAGSFVDERTRNGGMTWRPTRRPSFDPDDPATWLFSSARFIPSTWGGEVSLHTDVENAALYVQDYISFGTRVSISPGLRYGRWRGWVRPQAGAGERFLAVEDAAVEPRIGITLDPTGTNELVLKAHWGRYHQNMLSQLFDRVAGADAFTNEQLWFYRGAPIQDPATTFTVEERDRLAEEGLFTLEEEIVLNETGPALDYRQPYVDQWVVGVEKVFGTTVKLGAVYVNRRNRQMVALVDRNADRNYTVYEDVQVLDLSLQKLQFNGAPVVLERLYIPNDVLIDRLRRIANHEDLPFPLGLTLADLERLEWNPDYVLMNVPDARREFDQLQLSLETSLRTWGASGSIVLTRLRGNLDNVSGYDDPSGFGAGPYVRLNEGVNNYGFLQNFADRELKLSVYGQLPGRVRGGVYWNYRTGDHYSPQFTLSGLQYHYHTLRGGDVQRSFVFPLAGHNMYVGERGRWQYPARATVDLRVEREFTLGGGTLALNVDIFNLFNSDVVTEHNTSVNRGKNYYHFLEPPPGSFRRTDPNEYYEAVRERVAPRTLRIGTTVRF